MRIINTTTELQIRLRQDEVDNFLNMVLDAEPGAFRKEMVGELKRECLL